MKISQSNQSVILEVPFISWEDERLPVGEMNPSDPASYAMVSGYWGKDLAELSKEDDQSDLNDWAIEGKQGSSIKDLKHYIANQIPVLVRPTALTPFAHPISALTFELGVKQYPDTLEQTSGSLLGLFVPLDYPDLSERPDSMGLIREDFLWSSKVVVGYDDSMHTVYLHDPTFGPYWPVSYDDFDKMWEVGGRNFSIIHPPEYNAVLAEKSSIVKNIYRSAAHQATLHYLRKGLEIDDIDDGYHYLLNLELGMVRYKKDDLEEAMAFAKKASMILPEHHASWFLQANLYRVMHSNKIKIMMFALKAKKRKKSRKGSTKLPRNIAFNDSFLVR
jgi:hypothetical protein